jgi:hypothetical protein
MATTPSVVKEPSPCAPQGKNSELDTAGLHSLQTTEPPQSSTLFPQPTHATFGAVAYAGRFESPSWPSPSYYRLGSGVEYPHRGDQNGYGRELLRDFLALLRDFLRRREDPFADLRGRGPIKVSIEVRQVITPVRN